MDDEEIDSVRSNLNNILNLLGWTEESLLTEEAKLQCPLDASHMVPESTLKSHIERCKWLKGGYSTEEKEKDLPSASFSYPDAVSITFDKELLSKITSGTYANRNNSVLQCEYQALVAIPVVSTSHHVICQKQWIDLLWNSHLKKELLFMIM